MYGWERTAKRVANNAVLIPVVVVEVAAQPEAAEDMECATVAVEERFLAVDVDSMRRRVAVDHRS